jgi:hypothetical protein
MLALNASMGRANDGYRLGLRAQSMGLSQQQHKRSPRILSQYFKAKTQKVHNKTLK